MNRGRKLFTENPLLNRQPEEEYIKEWTLFIQQEKFLHDNQAECSVVLFRLNDEWFALNTFLFSEIAPPRKCHTIPHRTNAFVLGFVNLRGQFVVCVSMHHLLAVENPVPQAGRLLALKKNDVRFTFYAEEVFGAYHCPFSILQPTPITLSKSKDNYLKGIFKWQNNNVGLLDEDLIFQHFRRRVCERK